MLNTDNVNVYIINEKKHRPIWKQCKRLHYKKNYIICQGKYFDITIDIYYNTTRLYFFCRLGLMYDIFLNKK